MQAGMNVIRVAKWMEEHPGIKRQICENGYEVTPEEFIEIMEILEQNELYEMIYILLVKNQLNGVLERATSRILMEKASKEWERIGTEQMCKEIKDRIKEEIKLKETK